MHRKLVQAVEERQFYYQ